MTTNDHKPAAAGQPAHDKAAAKDQQAEDKHLKDKQVEERHIAGQHGDDKQLREKSVDDKLSTQEPMSAQPADPEDLKAQMRQNKEGNEKSFGDPLEPRREHQQTGAGRVKPEKPDRVMASNATELGRALVEAEVGDELVLETGAEAIHVKVIEGDKARQERK